MRAERLQPLLQQRLALPALQRLAHHLRRLSQRHVHEHQDRRAPGRQLGRVHPPAARLDPGRELVHQLVLRGARAPRFRQRRGQPAVHLVEDALVGEGAQQAVLGLFRIHLGRLGVGGRERARKVGARDHVRQPAGEQRHARTVARRLEIGGGSGLIGQWLPWSGTACSLARRSPPPAGNRPATCSATNAAVEAEFGVRLEVESIRTWKRADRFEGLDKALADLAAADGGADVDWVIGFAPALTFASAAHEQLGMGALFGRHLVLRGMFSLEETRALESVLDQLPREEREALLRERRLHKETAVLLHEWAHTLGAFHEHTPGSLMSPMYEPSQSGFSPGIVRLLQTALEQRSSRDQAGLSRWAAAYRDEVRSSTSIWDEATRAEALRAGEQFFGSARFAAGQQGGAPQETVRPAEPAAEPSPAVAEAGPLSAADAQRLEDAARSEERRVGKEC